MLAEVERVLASFAPRHHWGKLTTATPAELSATYPRLADFAQLRSECDPGGVFSGPLLDALIPP